MRSLISSTLTVVALLVVGCRPPDEPAKNPSRPVVLITVEGLVPADVRAFGGKIALPRLEGLVEQSAVWPAALSAVPMTRPAVATYLTGLAPDRHGVRDDVFAALPEDIPTLAELLAAEGYSTAAFPDSSFLSEQSGMWRGFELVDNPPPGTRDAGRWLPRFHDETRTGAAGEWIASLPPDTPWFAWVHLSHPLLGQFREMFNRGSEQELGGDTEQPEEDSEVATLDPEQTYEASLQAFDRQLGAIVDAVDSRDDGALVVLAGTMGDIRGNVERQIPMAMGFSLDATRVDVPLAIRFPAGGGTAEAPGRTVWSPDVAATIAGLTGIELDPRAEGEDLTRDPDPNRTVFSWSWATLDQFGWHPLVLAEGGSHRLVLDGDGVIGDEPADAAVLRQRISARANPEPRGLPSDIVDALIEAHGIEADPIGAEGRDFADPEARRLITGRVWLARSYYMRRNYQRAHNLIGTVSRRLDPQNVAAWVDRGHSLAFSRNIDSVRVLGRALALRPDDWDIWHWYAHALLRTERDDAEKILVAIQPHLSDQADVLYDLACTRSLAEDAEASAGYLARAWEAGFRDRSKIESDADLRHLRETGKLSEVMRQVQ